MLSFFLCMSLFLLTHYISISLFLSVCVSLSSHSPSLTHYISKSLLLSCFLFFLPTKANAHFAQRSQRRLSLTSDALLMIHPFIIDLFIYGQASP
jgi:hypothetical protein